MLEKRLSFRLVQCEIRTRVLANVEEAMCTERSCHGLVCGWKGMGEKGGGGERDILERETHMSAMRPVLWFMPCTQITRHHGLPVNVSLSCQFACLMATNKMKNDDDSQRRNQRRG